MIEFSSDLNACNMGNSFGLCNTMYGLKHTSRWNRYHHDSGSMFFPLNRGDFLTDRLAQNEFFEAHTRAKLEDS